MITDRISLNLIWIYLDQFQSNQGPVDDISIRYHSNEDSTVRKIIFANLDELNTHIQANAPLSNFNDIECFTLNLYELVKFNTVIDIGGTTSNKNIVSLDSDGSYTTNSFNINQANLDIINISYASKYREVYKQFKDLILDEYIIMQKMYIDCGYIQVYFEAQLIELQELYRMYRNK